MQFCSKKPGVYKWWNGILWECKVVSIAAKQPHKHRSVNCCITCMAWPVDQWGKLIPVFCFFWRYRKFHHCQTLFQAFSTSHGLVQSRWPKGSKWKLLLRTSWQLGRQQYYAHNFKTWLPGTFLMHMSPPASNGSVSRTTGHSLSACRQISRQSTLGFFFFSRLQTRLCFKVERPGNIIMCWLVTACQVSLAHMGLNYLDLCVCN